MNDCCKSKFWIGLGLGTILGAVCCQYSHTRQAKELKNKVRDAMQRMGNKTTEMWNSAKEKVADKMHEFDGSEE